MFIIIIIYVYQVYISFLDFSEFVYIWVLLPTLATSSMALINTIPAWQSPCGKTMVQSTLLDILGPVPTPTLPIKGILHNVVIELKETDEKVTDIQKYYVSFILYSSRISSFFFKFRIIKSSWIENERFISDPE